MITKPRSKKVVKAIEMFRQGVRQSVIAKTLNFSPASVHSALAYHGVLSVKNPAKVIGNNILRQLSDMENELRMKRKALRQQKKFATRLDHVRKELDKVNASLVKL
jgi:hypothetical protein